MYKYIVLRGALDDFKKVETVGRYIYAELYINPVNPFPFDKFPVYYISNQDSKDVAVGFSDEIRAQVIKHCTTGICDLCHDLGLPHDPEHESHLEAICDSGQPYPILDILPKSLEIYTREELEEEDVTWAKYFEETPKAGPPA